MKHAADAATRARLGRAAVAVVVLAAVVAVAQVAAAVHTSTWHLETAASELMNDARRETRVAG